jgi:gluconolactonase
MMAAANDLPDILETNEAERLATGFTFTEGPIWHPEGYWYFVDPFQNKLFRLVPGKSPEVVRMTEGGIGTTFDLQGRLILCEASGRRLTRTDASGKVETLVDKYKGGRFNFPDDVICHSNGCLYFTDPDYYRPSASARFPVRTGIQNISSIRKCMAAGACIGWRPTAT